MKVRLDQSNLEFQKEWVNLSKADPLRERKRLLVGQPGGTRLAAINRGRRNARRLHLCVPAMLTSPKRRDAQARERISDDGWHGEQAIERVKSALEHHDFNQRLLIGKLDELEQVTWL